MSRIIVEDLNPTEISVVEDNAENIVTVADVGLQGSAGQGVASGGTTGQLLAKNSDTDYDTEWIDPSYSEAGEAIYFLEDEADPIISGYKVMDNPAQLLAEAYVTQSTISDGQIIQTWITDVGLPNTTFIPAGLWQFKINAYKTGGTKEVRIYNELYKRDLSGTETLLGTTANSVALTSLEVDLAAFTVYIAGTTLLTTDRIVTKTRMRLVGSGSNPTSVTVGYSGSTAARLSFPFQGGGNGGITATDSDTIDFTLTGQDITAVVKDNSITAAKVVSNLKIHPITLSIDGAGTAITTGAKAEWRCPYNCTIQSWTLLADISTTSVIDIWKDTLANYPPTNDDSITNANEPTLTAATNAEDTDLGNWTTTTISAGDILKFNVDSNNNATRLTLILGVIKT